MLRILKQVTLFSLLGVLAFGIAQVTTYAAEQVDSAPVAITYTAAELPTTTLEVEQKAEEKPVKTPQTPLQAAINNAKLKPTSPQSEDLDVLVNEIMATIITDDMDTYDQVKASFDYIANTTSYGSHVAGLGSQVGNVTAMQIQQQYGDVEGYGAVVLTTHTGLCNAYSAAFILMAREIGLDAYLVSGSTQSAWGGYAYHEWAEICIDDTVYVFDPQLEQNLRGVFGEGNSFGKTYDEIPGRYVKSYNY